MKKILLATTVLVGTAGFAAAEVSLSGSGRMGVVYNDLAENEMSFSSRARVSFSMSGETDGGLAFGGGFDAHNSVDANAGTSGSVFISGAFGKIAMGDTSSAAENAVGDLAGVGYTGIGAFGGEDYFGSDYDFALGNEMIYISTGDNEMALYTYAAGDFTVIASVGQPGDGVGSYPLAAKYGTDAYSFALGYEDVEDAGDHIIAAGSATFSGVTLKGIYGTFDGDTGVEIDQYGVSASYTAGATTVDAFYRVTDLAGTDINAIGLGATYDLGGGAALEGGVANLDVDGVGDATVADLGVTFKF